MRADDPSLKKIEPPRLNWLEQLYLFPIAGGLGVTARHIGGVIFGGKAITMQYPEEQHVPSPNYRGVHRLNKDEHGRVKCVACMLCATACPAHCIDIVGATAPPAWPDREKYPESFVIDELRCIYCGMCEEACPVEAIELTGLYDLTGLSREEMIFDKTKLLSVFDATKDNEPMPFGKAEPAVLSSSTELTAMTNEPTRQDRCPGGSPGCPGNLFDAAPQARGSPAARVHAAGAVAAGLGLLLLPAALEAARRADSGVVLLRLRHRRDHRRRAHDHAAATRFIAPSGSRWWCSRRPGCSCWRALVPGGGHDHRLRRSDHRHVPVRDHAGADGREGPLRPGRPRPGAGDLHVLPALLVLDLRAPDGGTQACRRACQGQRARRTDRSTCLAHASSSRRFGVQTDGVIGSVVERVLPETGMILNGKNQPKPNVAGLGESLYTTHLVTVGLAGVLLFVALVGAVVITNPKRSAPAGRTLMAVAVAGRVP